MRWSVLGAVAQHLACPHCAGPLRLSPGTLRCPRGHAFDVARQGYANLTRDRRGRPLVADTADMVAARARFLAAGHFAPLQRALAREAAGVRAPGCVLDVAAGPGLHLATVLDAAPDRVGVALDLSVPAARRAARVHPRAGAVVADVWATLPVRDETAAVVLDVFAPRNAAEFARVLHPDGLLLVATPARGHLAELRSLARLLVVDPDKDRRLDAALGRRFERVTRHELTWVLDLRPEAVADLVAMGPNARHGAAPPAGRAMRVTAAVRVDAYRRTGVRR